MSETTTSSTTTPSTTLKPASSSPPSPVSVPLRALAANSLPLDTLTSAFGPSSLGIILVSDLPPQFTTLRLKLLQYASYLAHLPAEELDRLTVPEAKYLTGWSHGKETLKSGKKDEFKGSWYTNCSFYHERPSAVRAGALGSGGGLDAVVARLACEEAEREAEEEDAGRRTNGERLQANGHAGGRDRVSPDYRDYPEYSSPNVWPSEDLLPGFRQTLEEMVCLIIDVAVLVARQCDRFAAETGIEGYQKGYLERVVSTSKTTKARLLHYFPPGKSADAEAGAGAGDGDDGEDDDWCTTHKDHGCLTGLTSALFVDESSPAPVLSESTPNKTSDGSFELPQLNALKASPDPQAGLYIRSRTGELTKVAIPVDCLAFQTGEALEKVTKGSFAAVPHFVRGPRLGGCSGGKGGAGLVESVARNTLAVFTQPNLGESVDERGTTFAQFAREIVQRNTVEA